MTKEEAIRIISGEVLGTTEQTHEAVAMAVEALSAQREIIMCKDCKNHTLCAIEDEARDETFFCKWGDRRETDGQ